MNILEKFERLMALIEAESPPEEDTVEIDPVAAERERKRQERNLKGGSLAPASKYASGLQNVGSTNLPRTGAASRPAASSAAMGHVNELMVMVHDYLMQHGDLAIQKKADPKGSYIDQYKSELEREKQKMAGVKKPEPSPEDKFHKLSKEKVSSLMNDALDPQIGPDRRKAALNVFWTFLQSINKGRKEAWKEKVRQALKARTEQMTTLVSKKFQEQGKKVDPAVIAKRVAQKVKETFTMQLDQKTIEKDKQYDQEVFMVKEAMMTIAKQLQTLRSEEANYEYVPGAFGKPPKLVEKNSDEEAERRHNKAVRKSGEGEETVSAVRPTVRKGGAPSKPTSKRGGPLPTLSSDDSSDDIDAELRKLGVIESTNISRHANFIFEYACANRQPHWSDDI